MIVDSSALLAIALDEDDALTLSQKVASADRLLISAGTLLELRIVMDARRAPAPSRALDQVLRASAFEIVPVTEEHVRIGREAYARYGRGSGHPANLNLGDCFAYALATETGEPLLCKGEDFRHTDVEIA